MNQQNGQSIIERQRIIIGISGATGISYAITMLQTLRELDVETHLIVSPAAERTRAYESNFSTNDLKDLADVCYKSSDIGAAVASGSFKTMGMIIVPCSVKTLAEIATGITGNLISRAADVVLKERRKLVLTVSEYGGIIAPPVPAFYTNPNSIDDILKQTTGRVLDLFGIDVCGLKRWEGHPINNHSLI